MFKVLRERNYALLWAGRLVSLTGDWMLLIALPFYVYNLTGSKLATGAMFIAQMVPRLLLGSLAGVFVDRWNQKWTMIISDLSRALLLLLLLTAQSLESLWVIYLVALLQTTISLFFIPANSALLPRLVGDKRLLGANSLNEVTDNIIRLVAPASGGAIFALTGITSIVIFDSISFLISGILIAFIYLPSDSTKEADIVTTASNIAPRSTIWIDWLDGIRLVRRDREVTIIFIFMAVTMFAQGIVNVLSVAFVKDVLRGGAIELGWIETAQGVGGVIGGLIIGYVSKFTTPTRLIAVSSCVSAGLYLASINFPVLIVVLICTALSGVPTVIFLVNLTTLLQNKVAYNYRGRIFGTYRTSYSVTMLIGMSLASTIGGFVSVVSILNVAGGAYLLAGIIALLSWWNEPRTVNIGNTLISVSDED